MPKINENNEIYNRLVQCSIHGCVCKFETLNPDFTLLSSFSVIRPEKTQKGPKNGFTDMIFIGNFPKSRNFLSVLTDIPCWSHYLEATISDKINKQCILKNPPNSICVFTHPKSIMSQELLF